jgi:rhomboid protease GluP
MPEQPCAFHPNRLTLVACSSCGRPICPDDMIDAPVGVQCPVCAGRMREGPLGAAGYRARARVERWPAARLVRGASVTQLILAANVTIFLLLLATGRPTDPRTLLRYGALPAGLPRGEWWRLITSMFVHIGVAHLLFNSFALVAFGPAIEARHGRLRFLALYLASGLLAAASSLAFTQGVVRAGASGGVFGILGAWIAFFVRHRRAAGAAGQLRSLFFLVGINLFFGATVPGIDNFAHLGGLAAGLIVGGSLEVSARVRTPAAALGGLAGYVLTGGLAVLLILTSR